MRPHSTAWPSSSTSCTGRRWTCSIPWCEGRVDCPTGMAGLGCCEPSKPSSLHNTKDGLAWDFSNIHHSFQ